MSKFLCCLVTVLMLSAVEPVQLQAQPTADVPAGSVVEAVLLKGIDTKKNKVGDEIVAKVTKDVKSGDKVVIPKGSKIVGKLTDVKVRSQDQQQSVVTIAFDHAVLKDGSELPLTVTIQALSKPADDRTLDVSDSMRGTAPNVSAGTLGSQTTTHTDGSDRSAKFGPQSEGVSGYNGLGLQDSSILSLAQNIRLDSGTQLILQVSGK